MKPPTHKEVLRYWLEYTTKHGHAPSRMTAATHFGVTRGYISDACRVAHREGLMTAGKPEYFKDVLTDSGRELAAGPFKFDANRPDRILDRARPAAPPAPPPTTPRTVLAKRYALTIGEARCPCGLSHLSPALPSKTPHPNSIRGRMTTDTCQQNAAPEKPSDRIEAMMQANLNRCIKAIFAAAGTPLTDAEIATFRDGRGDDPQLQIAGLSCYVTAINAELDREAERRAEWEKRIEDRLDFLMPPRDIANFREDNPGATSVLVYNRVELIRLAHCKR